MHLLYVLLFVHVCILYACNLVQQPVLLEPDTPLGAFGPGADIYIYIYSIMYYFMYTLCILYVFTLCKQPDALVRHASGLLRARCGSTAQQSCEPATALG